jgi:hypothetical protein
LWVPIKKKIVRSRDVVFIEDKTIQDIGKPEKPKAITPQVILDPVNPPLGNDNNGGDDEDVEDSDDATDQGCTSQGHDQPSSDDDSGGDDNPPDSPPVQQPRRSGRHLVPSTKYPQHKYVLINNAVSPHSMKRQCLASTRMNGQKPCKMR